MEQNDLGYSARVVQLKKINPQYEKSSGTTASTLLRIYDTTLSSFFHSHIASTSQRMSTTIKRRWAQHSSSGQSYHKCGRLNNTVSVYTARWVLIMAIRKRIFLGKFRLFLLFFVTWTFCMSHGEWPHYCMNRAWWLVIKRAINTYLTESRGVSAHQVHIICNIPLYPRGNHLLITNHRKEKGKNKHE